MSLPKESPLTTNPVLEMPAIGDGPLPVQAQNSTDSLASVIFPWRTSTRSIGGNRRAVIARYETGRTITLIGFYLCMMSVLLLCTGVGLTIASIYLLVYSIPYVQITDGVFHSEAINFVLCVGVVCVLCWWIGWISHDNRKNYVFLPLLIVVLALSLCLLLTAVGIGFVQKSRMVFNRTLKPAKLISSHYRTLLNETLHSTLKYYGENENYKSSWDRVQQRLNCCGISGPGDWSTGDKEAPWSCYHNYKCPETKVLARDGCFDKIVHEFDCEVCLLIGLSMITFCIQVITMLLVCGVYIRDKVKKRNNSPNSI